MVGTCGACGVEQTYRQVLGWETLTTRIPRHILVDNINMDFKV
jgi:hypothetical protein